MSDLPFEMVKTGNGYSNDLLATNAKYLAESAVAQSNLSRSVEKLRSTQKEHTKVIVDLDGKSEILQNKVLWLTVATVILAIIQIVVALVK